MPFEFPLVDIIVITYNRYEEIQRTVQALTDLLTYPNLRWLIADDGTPGKYVDRLKRLRLFKDKDAEFIPADQNVGWGANVNRALAYSTAPFQFQIEDDYVLTQPLDLRVGVALLIEKPHLGLLRYGGTAGEHMILHQFEAEISASLPGWREHMGLPGKLTYLQLDGHCPTAYLYSHRPHLKHRRFHAFYGLYDEGRKLGDTEEAYAVRVKSMMQADPTHAPGIVVLPEWIPQTFDHIGKSYQHGEFDRAVSRSQENKPDVQLNLP
jgi:glycosyltransferase involved in cell wall biosynthesis